jgi:DNA-binding SARP family transcriptional activator
MDLWLDPALRVDYREVVEWAIALVDGHTGVEVSSWAPFVRVAQELLPDCYDDWALVERERFRQLRLHALEAACELLTRRGCYGQALMAGLAAVATEPLRESAQRLVVQAHISEGNWHEALRQYTSYADLLGSELGLLPSAAMEALVAPLGRSSHRGG